MIESLSVVTIWVKDLNEALRFYTEKLGFDICADYTHGDYRWLTVGLRGQPGLEFHLEALKPHGSLTPDDIAYLRGMIEAGKLRVGPWKTADCRATYEALSARGVEFVQPPIDRPYGTIEAIFKDDTGNLMLLVQDKP